MNIQTKSPNANKPDSSAFLRPASGMSNNRPRRDLVVASIVVALLLLADTAVYYLFVYRTAPTKQQQLGRVVYGWDSWPGVLPMLVASDRGFFRNHGVDVQLKQEASNTAILDDLANKKIDFSSDVVAVDVINQSKKGVPLQIVGISDASSGGDGIVAGQDIASIENLKGKRVAVEKGTFGELLLYAALKKDGLSLGDVTEVDLSAQDGATAFINKTVDAAVTYEPDFSRAVDSGSGHRLFTSADVPNLILDTIVFQKSFVALAPGKIDGVLRGYLDALTFIKNNPTEAYAIGAKYFNLSASEVEQQIKTMRLFTFDDNISALSYFSGQSSLIVSLTTANQFLNDVRKSDTTIYPDSIITPYFIRTIATEKKLESTE